MAGKGLAKTGGRRKGTPNKVTVEVRELVRQVLEEEGGVSTSDGLRESSLRRF